MLFLLLLLSVSYTLEALKQQQQSTVPLAADLGLRRRRYCCCQSCEQRTNISLLLLLLLLKALAGWLAGWLTLAASPIHSVSEGLTSCEIYLVSISLSLSPLPALWAIPSLSERACVRRAERLLSLSPLAFGAVALRLLTQQCQ